MKTIKELNQEFVFLKLQGNLPFRISHPRLRKDFNLDDRPKTEEEFIQRCNKHRDEGAPVEKTLQGLVKHPVTLKEYIALHGYMPMWQTWKEQEND